MDKFEYKILDVPKKHLVKENYQEELMSMLNKLGEQGWELITAQGLTEGSIFYRFSETTEVLLLFKRKIQA